MGSSGLSFQKVLTTYFDWTSKRPVGLRRCSLLVVEVRPSRYRRDIPLPRLPANGGTTRSYILLQIDSFQLLFNGSIFTDEYH